VEACPFCGGEVEESVVLYGGTCPHCFAHIPGEEAATDPGEEVAQAQAEQDRRRARRRALLPLLVVAPVVLILAGVATWLVLRPEPELAVLDLDAGEFYMPDADVLVVAHTEDEPPADATEEPAGDTSADGVADAGNGGAVASRGSAGTKAAARQVDPKVEAPVLRKPRLSGASDDDELLAELSQVEVTDATRQIRGGTADLGETPELETNLKISSSAPRDGVGTGFQMDVGSVSQSAAPLSNPTLIGRMVQRVLRRQLPRLRTCYDRVLRARPDLEGSWVLTFTIETDGSVRKATAIPEGASDATFEQCLESRMTAWQFERITKPQPVKKTVPFEAR
jgi:hypothetical protein